MKSHIDIRLEVLKKQIEAEKAKKAQPTNGLSGPGVMPPKTSKPVSKCHTCGGRPCECDS